MALVLLVKNLNTLFGIRVNIVGSSGCGSLNSLSSCQFRVHLPMCCEEVSSFAFCLGVRQIFSMRYEG
jgi:hypothetical protein